MTPIKSLSRSRSTRRAAAAIEFAVVAPVFILLALGMADFGRSAACYEVVCSAARSAAELGASQQFTDYSRPDWEERVRETAIAELENLRAYDSSKSSIDVSTQVDSDGYQRVAVSVSYRFDTVVTWPGVPSSFVVERQIEFRQFR